MGDKIIIFTDGASKGNPGRGGWGAIVFGGGTVREIGGGEKQTTNNRMELVAALEALRISRTIADGKKTALYTDSNYLINGITKWVAGWKRGNWITKGKKDVLNRDLWEAIDEAVAAYPSTIAWTYVGGHVGVRGNERVDRIASDFADGKPVELFDGPSSDYPIDLTDTGLDKAKGKAKSASRSRSKAVAYSYVSEVGGEVRTHKTWAECEARVKGKRAKFKKALSSEEEKRIVEEFSRRT